MSWKDKARERVKEKQSGGNFKPAEGDNVIRILPNPKGEEYPPYVEYRIHREVGPDKRLVRCTKSISGKGECWLCSKIEELQNSGNRAKIAAASAMAAVEWMALQIAVLDEKTGKLVGPTRWQIGCSGGKSLGVKLQALLAKEGRSYEHPVKGRNLTLNRTGTGLKTVYGAFEADEESSKVPQSILERLKPLAELLSKDNEQTQKDAFFGRKRKADEDDEDEAPKKRKAADEDDEDEAPKKKRPAVDDEDDEDDEEEEKPKKKGKAKPVDDEEEEDEEEEDDEEEEKPKKKGKSKAKPVEDEEDEEEEDEEEEDGEEEDEAPPKKKGKKKPADDEDEEEEDEEEEDEEEEEDDEEEEAPPKKKGKSKAKPEDDEDDEDSEPEEEEEEEEEKPKKKAPAKKPAKAPAKKPAKAKK